jgi:hypothetical protein
MVDAGTSHVEPARLVIAWQGRPRAKLGDDPVKPGFQVGIVKLLAMVVPPARRCS